MPALLTSASIDLVRASAVSTILAAVASSPMWPSTRATWSVAAISVDWVTFRELATTLNPRSTNPFTIPAPIPCEAPVTMAVFPGLFMAVYLENVLFLENTLLVSGSGIRVPHTKCRHDLPSEACELLDHDVSRRPDGPADHDVVQPRVPLLDLLQIGNDVSGRPAEPRAIAHAVLQGGRGCRLCLAGDHRLHVLLAVAKHAERGHDLGVLLEVRARPLHCSIAGLVDAHPEAEDQVFPERELAAMSTRRLMVVAEPALDQLLGGGGDDALDAVPGHEVQAPRAAAHDGLPDLDGLVQGPGHERDLLQGIAAIGHLGGNRVVFALVREGLLAKRL